MSRVRLLLVDDHLVLRAGLRMLLEAQPGFVIVGEASSGAEALALLENANPDVVIMDVVMPGMSGIEATRRIRNQNPRTQVLALTMHEDEQYFFEMLQAGASGYIPKRAAPDDLVSAIRTVSRGGVFLYPSLARMLVSDYLDRSSSGQMAASQELTNREQEVLTLIADGLTNREIGDALVISPKTVARHRENIMRKLNLHNRTELVKYAIEKGLIHMGPSGQSDPRST